jgi:hypothetical protein
MPVKLGLTAAGDLSSALGGSGKAGPTSTENVTGGSNTTVTGSSSGTTTPNLNPLMAGFQSSLVPALQGMMSEANTPVYGNTQIAQVANQGDAATNAASDALQENLARRGVVNSGASAAGNEQLQAANVANTVGFENQIPLLNYQNEMQQQQNVLGLGEKLTGPALSTGTTQGSGTTNTVSTNSKTTTESGPAFMAGLLNSAGGGLTSPGASSLFGAGKGGGKGYGAPSATNSPANIANPGVGEAANI